MTTFTFTDPSGKTHEVTGPAGATQAQAFGILQQRLGATAPPEPPPPPREASSKTERFLTGLADPVVGAAQLAEKTGLPKVLRKALGIEGDMDDYVRQRNAAYQAPEGVDWMRMAGNVANPVNLAAPGAGVARAAAMGATQSALAPVDPDADFATEKAKQMALGGVSAGVLSKALPRALGGVVKPTDEALALQRQGITLTPGQAAGGTLNSIEQKAMSLPVVGEMIGKARTRALDDFQGAALKRATGSEGVPRSVDEANAAVSRLYQEVVPHIRPDRNSDFLVEEAIEKARHNPELTDAGMKMLEKIHSTRFKNYHQLDGPALKRLDSELGAIARRHSGMNALPSDKVLAHEVRQMQDAMRQGWRLDMADPAKADLLDRANKAYRAMVPINKAASQRADEVITPRALQKQMAKHEGLDVSRMKPHELVDPGVAVLGSTVPDSGTAGRLYGPLGIGAAVADPVSTILGTIGAGAAYTRRGANFLTGNTDIQRQLAKLEPAARKALIAALRAQQAQQPDEGEK